MVVEVQCTDLKNCTQHEMKRFLEVGFFGVFSGKFG